MKGGNITHEKQAEEDQDRFFTISLDMLCIAGFDGYFKRLNPAWERTLGYTAAELLAEPFLSFVHPGDRERTSAEAASLAEGRDAISFENRYRCKDGSYRWMLWTATPDPEHKLIYAAARDITDRKAAEEELHRNQQQLQAVFAATPDMITVIGPDGEIADRSPAMHDVLGYEAERFFGATALEIVHPEDRQLVAESFQDLMRGEARAIRYRAQHAEGRWVTLETKARIIRDAEGRPAGAVSISRDITERALLEEALLKAKDEAEEANHAKSDFLSRMSHELRTPLNAILGFGQLLEMGHLDAEQSEAVQQVLKAGRHLLDLINEVLDIARIESGSLSISLEPVGVGDALREALDLIGPLATQRRIQPRNEVGASEVYVVADRQRLKQVLLNLLSNAVKYNRDGGTVTVSCRETEGAETRLEVTDTGGGIDLGQLDRLFVPFDRLGAEQSAVEGSGIGLALSKRLVELMGGNIGVESRPGEGSMFWVQLPTAENPDEEMQRSEEPLETLSERNGVPRTILYIEDNLSNLRLIERVLAHRPSVELVPSMQGGLGLELAREHRPDLILLDVHLPDMQGDEVLRRLRRDPATAHIPVVVISADATPGQVRRLRSAGALDYLTKPLDVKQFLRVLDEVLNGADGPIGARRGR